MDIRVERATVASKDVQYLKNGDMFMPDHRLAFCVLFTLQGGEKVVPEVPEDKFDAFRPGDAKELAWHSHMILSFGDMEFPTYP